jgi:hypothetical protein
VQLTLRRRGQSSNLLSHGLLTRVENAQGRQLVEAAVAVTAGQGARTALECHNQCTLVQHLVL